MKESNIKLFNYCHYIFFIIVFFIGLYVYKDFGFNIDETFQRRSGFYWLNYITEFLQFENFSNLAKEKFVNSYDFTIPWGEKDKAYGIVFDVPAAFFEIIFNIEEPIKYYQLRHLLTFIYFFIGLVFFYKIIQNRFRNRYISLLACVLLFLTPRIFGEIFHNNKDIIFLSIFIIALYFYFKTIENEKISNILLFALFSAIATSTRLFGIIFPISFIFLFFLSVLSKKNDLKKINYLILYLIFYFIILIIHWPYLWNSPVQNFISHINNLNEFGSPSVFFNGNFYNAKLVPYYYLILWIMISTPIFNLLFFLGGFYISIKYFFKKLLNVDKLKSEYDFWNNVKEKKDFFILLFFLIFIIGGTFLSINHYNSWRVFYFLNVFIVYFIILFLEYLLQKKSIEKHFKIFLTVILISIIFNVFRLYIYHPYQSLHFNSLLTNNFKNKFEVDYAGLSGIKFLRDIVKNEKSDKIKIGVNSWYPLWRLQNLLTDKEQKKISFIFGDINNADVIYSNRIYDVNIKKSKKYKLNSTFKNYKRYIIDGVIIYEILKK